MFLSLTSIGPDAGHGAYAVERPQEMKYNASRKTKVLRTRVLIQSVLLIIVLGLLWFLSQDRFRGAGRTETAGTREPAPLVTAPAKPRGPIFFVALQGEGTASQRNEVIVLLKKINLPEGYDRAPVIKANGSYWLASPLGIWLVTCKSVQAAAGREQGPGGGQLEIMLQSRSPLQGNSWLLAEDPFPPQMWQQKEVTAKGVDLRVIITTHSDEFMLDSIYLPDKQDEDADGPAQVRIDIHRKQKNETGWTKINSFITNSEVRSYIDVDGDGVPEIINVEWYDEGVLRSFYPEIKVIAIDHSGV